MPTQLAQWSGNVLTALQVPDAPSGSITRVYVYDPNSGLWLAPGNVTIYQNQGLGLRGYGKNTHATRRQSMRLDFTITRPDGSQFTIQTGAVVAVDPVSEVFWESPGGGVLWSIDQIGIWTAKLVLYGDFI